MKQPIAAALLAAAIPACASPPAPVDSFPADSLSVLLSQPKPEPQPAPMPPRPPMSFRLPVNNEASTTYWRAEIAANPQKPQLALTRDNARSDDVPGLSFTCDPGTGMITGRARLSGAAGSQRTYLLRIDAGPATHDLVGRFEKVREPFDVLAFPFAASQLREIAQADQITILDAQRFPFWGFVSAPNMRSDAVNIGSLKDFKAQSEIFLSACRVT